MTEIKWTWRVSVEPQYNEPSGQTIRLDVEARFPASGENLKQLVEFLARLHNLVQEYA
jgi:hypothetical protein